MTKLILLIEDNPSDEKLALLAFKRAGVACELAVARDGAEALDYLFATGKHEGRDPMVQPALILLDLKMPRIGGLEVLRRIRARPETRLVPVVVLTASREDEDLIAAYSLGANAYLRKPIDFAVFSEAAGALGAFWLRFNELAPVVRGA